MTTTEGVRPEHENIDSKSEMTTTRRRTQSAAWQPTVWLALLVVCATTCPKMCDALVASSSTLRIPSSTCLLLSASDNSESDSDQPLQLMLEDGDTTVKFGDSVPLRAPVEASFGESVPLRSHAKSTLESELSLIAPDDMQLTADDGDETMEQTLTRIRQLKRRNITVAILSVLLAIANYAFQFMHPVTPLQLLVEMEQQSAPITQIGMNGKPTVVDFWAPWCSECRNMAPTLHKVEEDYAGRVNFVSVNGDKNEAWPLIEAFGVDAIPHMALISAEGDVETALIGPIPKHILEKDLDVLLDNAKNPSTKEALPFTMLDAFAGNPAGRRVHFDTEER